MGRGKGGKQEREEEGDDGGTEGRDVGSAQIEATETTGRDRGKEDGKVRSLSRKGCAREVKRTGRDMDGGTLI